MFFYNFLAGTTCVKLICTELILKMAMKPNLHGEICNIDILA